MLKFVKGDMFKTWANVRVNTVNCKGVMGKGIALEFKRRYPQMFDWYKEECKKGTILPGGISLCITEEGPLVINFATKDHWKDPSRYEWIEKGLKQTRDLIKNCKYGRDITITIPALGCNNGGLEWRKVKPLMKKYLSGHKCQILVFEPLEVETVTRL